MGRKFELSQRKGYQKTAKHQPVEEEEVTEDASCSTTLQSVAIQTEVLCFDEASVAIQTDISCFDEASVAIQTDDSSCLGVTMSSDLELLYMYLHYDRDQVCHVWNLHQFSCLYHHHRDLYLLQSHCVLICPNHQNICHSQIRICWRYNQHQHQRNLL